MNLFMSVQVKNNVPFLLPCLLPFALQWTLMGPTVSLGQRTLP